MASTTRAWVVAGVMMAAIGRARGRGQARTGAGPRRRTRGAEAPRVHTNDPALAALIQEATTGRRRSGTWRRGFRPVTALCTSCAVDVATMSARAWRCGSGSPRPTDCCEWSWTTTRPTRRRWRPSRHELRHVLEVLDEPRVRSSAEMFFFYKGD